MQREKLEKLHAKREQEEKEIKEQKKRYEEEKAKEENIRKAKEENERKDFEAREKLKKESDFERKSKVVELKSNSTLRELIVRDLVCNPSPIPFMKTQVPKGVFPSLNSSHFFIKSLVLFPSQIFFLYLIPLFHPLQNIVPKNTFTLKFFSKIIQVKV